MPLGSVKRRVKSFAKGTVLKILKRFDAGRRLIYLLKSAEAREPSSLEVQVAELRESVEHAITLTQNAAKVTMDLEDEVAELRALLERLRSPATDASQTASSGLADSAEAPTSNLP